MRMFWFSALLLLMACGGSGDDAADAGAAVDADKQEAGACSDVSESCATHDCCDGLYCVDSVCSSEPGACVAAQGSCERSDCCNGLACVDKQCVVMPAGCARLDEACGAGAACCPGTSCDNKRCVER